MVWVTRYTSPYLTPAFKGYLPSDCEHVSSGQEDTLKHVCITMS